LAYGQYHFSSYIVYWLITLSAIFTAIYSTRLLYITFIDVPKSSKYNYLDIHEAPITIFISITLLAILSIFFGYIGKDIFIGIGTNFWSNSLFIHPNHSTIIDSEFSLPLFIKLFPLIGSLSGILFIFILYNLYPSFLIYLIQFTSYKIIYQFLIQKYWFNNLYSNFIVYGALNFAGLTNKILDKGVIEILGPIGLTHTFKTASSNLITLDTQLIPNYAIYILVSLVSFVFILFIILDPHLLILLLWTIFLINTFR